MDDEFKLRASRHTLDLRLSNYRKQSVYLLNNPKDRQEARLLQFKQLF